MLAPQHRAVPRMLQRVDRGLGRAARAYIRILRPQGRRQAPGNPHVRRRAAQTTAEAQPSPRQYRPQTLGDWTRKGGVADTPVFSRRALRRSHCQLRTTDQHDMTRSAEMSRSGRLRRF
ncbi:hypothetical protein ISCGN_001655 [Ixodes scapularis]